MSQQKGCPTCVHAVGITGMCKAFPNGIPVVFTSGQFLHDKVVEGQVGDFVWTKEEASA